MFEVFFVDVRSVDAKKAKRLCCTERLRKLERLKNGAQISAAAEMVLIKAVRHFYRDASLPLRYKRNQNGKPYLTDYPKLYVNISHSGDWAMCAVSDREVGVDIQQHKNIRKGFAKRFFTEEERAYIADSKERFFEVWTKKEAYVKAVGVGISVPLNSFSVLEKEYIKITAPQGYTAWGFVL